ncbi:MAG TPA: hypothetical protein VF233_06105, partial [Nitrososphaeraceae archaeon]
NVDTNHIKIINKCESNYHTIENLCYQISILSVCNVISGVAFNQTFILYGYNSQKHQKKDR